MPAKYIVVDRNSKHTISIQLYPSKSYQRAMIKLEALYSGKAKTVFKTDDPKKLIMEFRDSLTAFDGKKKSEAPKKGYYNAQISAKLFKLLEGKGIKTHFDSMLSDTEMVVDAVEIVKIEVIVRNIAAGSLTKKYPFKTGQKLDPPILLFDYKSDEHGDPMINDDIALALGLATKEELLKIRKIALKINSVLVGYLDEKNLLLPDFKLEFGRRGGEIVLADEISCDTCRFWDKTTGESLDKDVFRFDKGDLVAAYREVAKRVVPEIF
jgi:phosphoribosylaminoimidazole-succinocarboxamide synthase